jgi:tetratricopeptide (TPR) repeat protein
MAAETFVMGRPAAVVEWADKAIILAREVGADEARQYALQMRGEGRCDLGDLGGLHDLREALELGLELGFGRFTAIAYNNLANQLRLTEGPAAALRSFQAGLDLCKQRGIVDLAMMIQASLLDCLFDLGDWAELITVADQVITWSHAQGGSYHAALAEAVKAGVLIWRGKVGAAAPLADESLRRAREIGDPQVLVVAFPISVLVEQARGNLTAAVGLVEEFDRATRKGPGRYRALVLPDLVRVCVAASDLSLGWRLFEGLDVSAARLQTCLTTARAALLEAETSLEEATRLYAKAAARWAGYGCVLEHGQALLGAGRCLDRLGRPNAPSGYYRRAPSSPGSVQSRYLPRRMASSTGASLAARDGPARRDLRQCKFADRPERQIGARSTATCTAAPPGRHWLDCYLAQPQPRAR